MHVNVIVRAYIFSITLSIPRVAFGKGMQVISLCKQDYIDCPVKISTCLGVHTSFHVKIPDTKF